jgi:hypothetical protein
MLFFAPGSGSCWRGVANGSRFTGVATGRPAPRIGTAGAWSA